MVEESSSAIPTARDLAFDTLGGVIDNLLSGTFLEDYSGAIGNFTATLIMCLVGFAGIMLSMFMILWLERKILGRLMDRRGATTALRSLWVGENGTTAGEWWNMLPFGLGTPIGAVVKWLNKNFGNDDSDRPTVDRVNNRSWMGYVIFPGFFQTIADGMKMMLVPMIVNR